MAEVRAGAEGVRWFGLWRFFLRFAAPLFLLFVLWEAVPDALGAIAGLFSGG